MNMEIFLDFEDFENNTHIAQLQFDPILYDIETWLTMSLSSFSALSIVFITIIYFITQIRSRDRIKETRKSIIRKLIKNEYLLFSYCLSLFFSHLISVSHKLTSKFFIDGVDNIESLCLIIGILKHYFWLLTLFHSNAVSIRIYLKLSRSLSNNLTDKQNWIKTAFKIFSYIYGSSTLILACSILIHFYLKNNPVYELRNTELINSCFLTQPLYLIVFFAFPVLVILICNIILFIIVYLKTKNTINQADNNEMNNLFLKLATIMGLSWFVYLIGVIIIEVFSNHLVAQIIAIISSCQINLQGLVIVLGLYSNVVFDLFANKKSIKNSNRIARNNINNNNNNNNNLDVNNPINQQQQNEQQKRQINVNNANKNPMVNHKKQKITVL